MPIKPMVQPINKALVPNPASMTPPRSSATGIKP